MNLLAVQQRTIMIIAIPMLACSIAAIFLMSWSVTTFAYHKPSIIMHPKTEPLSSALFKYIVSSNSNNSSEKQLIQNQPQSKIIEASGHFANNQIENDSVSWIQGGLWHLIVYNSSSNNTAGVKSVFSGNFTMVKPDGSQTHEHSVGDFRSNNVIIAGGDMIITGIGNIYENAQLKYKEVKYKEVPITVHLMGKEHVLGLIIDPVTTDRHFVSDHEMFGTLIKGTGLEKIEKTLPPQKNGKGMNMNGMAM